MRRIHTLSVLGALVLHGNAYGVDQPGTRIVVTISGQLSSNAADIVDGDPATFPLPSLLGGSFAGSFEYRTDAMRTGFVDFPFSAMSVNVFDNAGRLVHTIELPTS